MGDVFRCPACNDYNDFRTNMLANGIFIVPDDTSINGETNSEASSEASSEANSEASDGKQKNTRVRKNWLHEKTFNSKVEAETYINNEKCWSYSYVNNSDAGKRINYRCNLVKFRGKQCAAAMYLLFDSRSTQVFLF